MRKCHNCGQSAARTEDWACQWCGYPLLSSSYKKIPKTYKQLREEGLAIREEPDVVMESGPLMKADPEVGLVSEVEAVSEAEVALEVEAVSEAEVAPKAKTKAKTKTKAKAKSKARTKAVPKAESEPKQVSKTESVLESQLESAPVVSEISVEGLLAAYEEHGVAADVKILNKILSVTGVIDRIEVRDTLGIYYIVLNNAEKTLLQGLRCVFDRHYGPELSQLIIGQTVTVQGKYDGSIMDIRMRDCVLIH
ncbi:hypothetical protein ACFLUJ_05595 [Chloroflexota bacterium]